MTAEPRYLTIQAAADALATNRRRIWQMIRDGELQAVTNPLDRREKLILRSDVEKLSEFAHAGREPWEQSDGKTSVQPSDRETEGSDSASPPWPRTVGAVSDPGLRSDEIEEWLEAHWQRE